MYQLLNRRSVFDRSPFQFARMEYLKGRVTENFEKLLTLRQDFTGRLESSHLLFKILTNLNVSFNGDLSDYIESCEREVKRLAGGLGLVTSYSKGREFTDYQFYDGCTEIITAIRDESIGVMDVWTNWRAIEPIKVMVHPYTDLTVVELGVMNSFKSSGGGLAIVNVDIPMLAIQWAMWKSTYPNTTMEMFLTAIPLANAVKSHLDVALFNIVCASIGVLPKLTVSSNLPFAQTPTNGHAEEIARDVVNKLSVQRLTSRQILSTVPAVFGENYYNRVYSLPAQPTNQVIWALIARAIDCTGLVLEQGERTGYDKLLKEIADIKRTVIQATEDKQLSNGLSNNVSMLLQSLLQERVLSRLPE